VLLVFGAVLSVAARTEGVTRAAQDGSPSADVVITGDVSVAAGLEDVVTELLERRSISAHVARAAHVDPADFLRAGVTSTAPVRPACRIWIDVRDGRRVRIFLADVAGERFAIRELALGGHVDEVARESIGQLVAAAASALIEGTESSVSLEEAERTLGITPLRVAETASASSASRPASTARTASKPKRSLDLGAFYAAATFAPQHWLTHGPGLLLDWGGDNVGVGARAWLLLALQLPVPLGEGAVSGRLITTTARGGASVERGWPSAALAAGLGAGVDLIHVASRPGTDPSAALYPATYLVIPSIRVQLVLKAHLGRRLYLIGAATCDVDLLTTSYEFVQAGQEVEAVTPWRVHPGLLFGAIWR
jgi:hypothetical protein